MIGVALKEYNLQSCLASLYDAPGLNYRSRKKQFSASFNVYSLT